MCVCACVCVCVCQGEVRGSGATRCVPQSFLSLLCFPCFSVWIVSFLLLVLCVLLGGGGGGGGEGEVEKGKSLQVHSIVYLSKVSVCVSVSHSPVGRMVS